MLLLYLKHKIIPLKYLYYLKTFQVEPKNYC